MKYGKLIFKNLFRNLRRSLLTVSSLAVSLFLIVTLSTVVTAIRAGSEQTSPVRLVTRHAVSLILQIPSAYQSRISNVPGVKLVTPFTWVGGIYKDPQNFFANFAVDAKAFRDYSPETKMSDAQWAAFANDRQGAIV